MQTPQWICHDGTGVPLSSMSTEHALNVLRYLRRGDGDHGPMLRQGCSGFSNHEWVRLLGAELCLRARRHPHQP
jgi:hypothetical protein